LIESRKIEISCGQINLEGVFEFPEEGDEWPPVALALHPHPLYGGNMLNNVTSKLASGLLKIGIATLRFNFRGVGGSGGEHGDGVAEMDDVKAALSFIDRYVGVDSSNIILAGYSFGCWVGLKAAFLEDRPMRLVGVSPPLDIYDFSFLTDEMRPKLLIAGDRDFVCSQKKFQELSENVPEPKRIVLLPGVDHFHFGAEEKVVDSVVEFLRL
jgi:alpha/beta superfamily hydrolase